MRTGVEVAEGLRAWAAAFPDGFVEMTNVIATGPWIVVEWHARGTQTGPLRGEPPSGRRLANDFPVLDLGDGAASPLDTATTLTARRCTSHSG